MKTFRGELTKVRDLLKSHIPFALARFGHAELEMLQGKLQHTGEVSGGHEYRYAPADADNEQPRQRLWEAFRYRHPNYFVGINCPHCVSEEEFEWLRANSGQPEEQLTFSTIYFYSNYAPFLSEVVPLFRQYDSVLVCNQRGQIDQLPFAPGKTYRNGYDAWHRDLGLIEQLKMLITGTEVRGGLFLFCAGALSCILAHELFEVCPENTYLDIGSSLDPYLYPDVQGRTRRYLKQDLETQAAESCYWPL